jgi:hypothetical protein
MSHNPFEPRAGLAGVAGLAGFRTSFPKNLSNEERKNAVREVLGNTIANPANPATPIKKPTNENPPHAARYKVAAQSGEAREGNCPVCPARPQGDHGPTTGHTKESFWPHSQPVPCTDAPILG